jgi:hypothetical protein
MTIADRAVLVTGPIAALERQLAALADAGPVKS